MNCQSKIKSLSEEFLVERARQRDHNINTNSFIIAHLHDDNTIGECHLGSHSPSQARQEHLANFSTPEQTDVLYASSCNSPNLLNQNNSLLDNEQQPVSSPLASRSATRSQNSTGCYQVSPMSCGRESAGSEHRMLVNGDALTLVILDCCPTPCGSGRQQTPSAELRPGSGQLHQPLASLKCPTTSPGTSGDNASRCSCLTELIVRQHTCTPLRGYLSPDQQHQPLVCVPATLSATTQPSTTRSPTSYDTHQVVQTTVTDTLEKNTSIDERSMGNTRNSQYMNDENYLSPHAHYRQHREEHRDHSSFMTPDNRTMKPSHESQIKIDSSVTQTNETNKSPTQSSAQLVRRWDWNKQEFVYTEAPQRPGITRQFKSHKIDAIEQKPLGSAELNKYQSQNLPERALHQFSQPNFVEAQAGDQPESLTLTGLPVQQQVEPSWLSYRVPDLESMRSDPLYSDLMYEIQKLEEQLPRREVPPAPPIESTELPQKPVFGQSITPDYIEVQEYEPVEFVCRLMPSSDPAVQIEWTVNGKPLQQSNRYTSEHDFGVVRLRIKRCEAEDSGIYQCRAHNSMGEAITTGSLRVNAKGSIQCESLHPAGLVKIRQLENPEPVSEVEEQEQELPPKFITHIQDYVEKEEGDSVHFECRLSPVDDPDLKTEWFFNGRPLVTGSRFHTIDDFGFIVLDIDWLFPRDTGEYVCRATNKHGSDITRTVMRVKPAKNIILESQLDNPMLIDKLRLLEFPEVDHQVEVEQPKKPAHFLQHLTSEPNQRRQFVEGDNVHFEARVGPATDGNLTVEWFHNDKPLISGHRFKPSFDFGHIQLDILYVYSEDSGIYKCVSRNESGQAVSQFEIQVQGKPSLVYQSQLPKEMEGGVQKITEMEAMWNRSPDPEEEEPPAEREPPVFVLAPKPYTAFEGSCARFCCRVSGYPRPRVTWTLNGRTVVSGSRWKLTYDGMHHLTIPKCQLNDAGKLEVHARNPLGECYTTTRLSVKRKVDDFRGVLKNSPNPWYDEQSLKVYQRQRSQDLTDEEDLTSNYQGLRLQLAPEHQSSSPVVQQVVGYMEPDTPDVNLLAVHSGSPLFPGQASDFHPVVTEKQVVMATAPSTIHKAMVDKDSIKTPQKSFQLPASTSGARKGFGWTRDQNEESGTSTGSAALSSNLREGRQLKHLQTSHLQTDETIEGDEEEEDEEELQYLENQSYQQQQGSSSTSGHFRAASQEEANKFGASGSGSQLEAASDFNQLKSRSYSKLTQSRSRNKQEEKEDDELLRQQQLQQHQAQMARLPPPRASPESTVRGREVHAHTHKQTQKERRSNKEILREIIEKETFEQEHKSVTKDQIVRGSSAERRSATPLSESDERRSLESQEGYALQTQQHEHKKRQVQFQSPVLIEDSLMVPPEFIKKIQPCQALDGDEARFECTFKGDPTPSITWFRESKQIKESNLYRIVTDLEENKSTLIIKRVALNSNAVYTVKAENCAGTAKSSANLVVESYPTLPDRQIQKTASQFRGERGYARLVESPTLGEDGWLYSGNESSFVQQQLEGAPLQQLASREGSCSSSSVHLDEEGDSLSQKRVRSVRTRKLEREDLSTLIRASPEGMVAPTFLHTIHDTNSKPGELARLDARLVGSPALEVLWLKDGAQLKPDKGHKMVVEGDLYTLIILECSHRDEGYYECVARNAVGEARCKAKLSVASSAGSSTMTSRTPDLLQTSSRMHHSHGSSAYAASNAGSEREQAGSFTGAPVSGAQVAQQQSQSTSATTTTSASTKQYYGLQRHQYNPLLTTYSSSSGSSSGVSSGSYTAPGGSTHSPGQYSSPSAPKLIKRLENQRVIEGKSVTLRCQISSFPLAEVHWYKGGAPIKSSKYFRIFKDNDETYCLKILETFPEDQGEYRCIARSSSAAADGQRIFEVETKAQVTVIPSSPE